MSADQIALYNKQLADPARHLGVVDMASFPESLPGSEIRRDLSKTGWLEKDLYWYGLKMTEADKSFLKGLLDIKSVPDQVNVRYAVVVRHSDLRCLPTREGIFSEPDDVYYDNAQDSVAEAGEPVAVLHTSKDGRFCYVQMYNVRSWIERENVAFCDRKTWMSYVDSQAFLVVVGNRYLMPFKDGRLFFLEGAKIKLLEEKPKGYEVVVPTRGDQGNLVEVEELIPLDPALRVGYLPYTSNNVIREAFKFQGDVYGWGGSFNSVDCSSLVDSVYRTMGFCLPRNTAQLQKIPGKAIPLEGRTREEKREIFRWLRPGTPLHMRGHIMIYLGMNGSEPYVIHSASSYYEEGKKLYVRKVLVSDLNLGLSGGKTYEDEVIQCGSMPMP